MTIPFLTDEAMRAEIRRLCVEHGSQGKFARHIGVTPAAVSRVLAGIDAPGLRITRALGYQRGYAKVRRVSHNGKPLNIEISP